MYTATTAIYTLSLHDALPIFRGSHGYGAAFSKSIEGNWGKAGSLDHHATIDAAIKAGIADPDRLGVCGLSHGGDRKSTRLNSSHLGISYAVFCMKKKTKKHTT